MCFISVDFQKMYRSVILFNTKCKDLSVRVPIISQIRWKSRKEKKSYFSKKKTPAEKALEHFDDFYKKVYGKKWPSIRLGLLSPHKYCAIINNYAETDTTIQYLENIGALSLKTLCDLEKENIKQKKHEEERKRDLENVFRLDRKMEQMMIKKQEEDLLSLYPQKEGSENTQIPSADILSSEDKSQEDTDLNKAESLNAGDEDPEIGLERVIDPASGLSAAALYEYVPATRLKGMEEWIGESQHYRYYKSEIDFPVQVENDHHFLFPKHLKVYTFERGNISSFPSPRRDITGVFNYYLMDASSLLPVLALDMRPGDTVLDMCAAPGGKSFIMLQTLYPANMVCNDNIESRVNRIRRTFKQFLYENSDWENKVVFTQRDGREISDFNLYNKILVDVPCTTDRHSLFENDNNIFSPARTKERLKIPEMQSELLSQALKLVRPGGTVVYSTCSLSPIQNDGVVHMALQKIWEETDIQFVIKDMTSALRPLQCIFKLGEDLGIRYGHIVLPFLPNNFGPMYFCKLVRTK